MALVPRRHEVRVSPGNLPSRGRRQVERHRARAGHGRRPYPLLRDQPSQGPDREPGHGQARGDRQGDGLPPALWFEEELSGADVRGVAGAPEGLAGRVGRLFDMIEDPKTGETYTNAKVARMSLGDLTEEDVEGLRSGSVTDSPLEPPARPGEGLRRGALLPRGWHRGGAHRWGDCPGLERQHDPGDHTRLRPPAGRREKGIVLGIVRQFEAMGANDSSEPVERSADRPADRLADRP
jgi:hypothetical protein